MSTCAEAVAQFLNEWDAEIIRGSPYETEQWLFRKLAQFRDCPDLPRPPKPIEAWANVYEDGHIVLYRTEGDANRGADSVHAPPRRCVKLVEDKE